MKLLILGGTGEAAAFARTLADQRPDWHITTALAGRTAPSPDLPGQIRVGGFGGAEGLAAWLRGHGIQALVDGTHPFAQTISAHARIASQAAGVPLIALERPDWVQTPADRWIAAVTGKDAAQKLPGLGQRPFLTVGRQGLAPFLVDPVAWALVRLLAPAPPPAPGWIVIAGKGPFDEASELETMTRHGIDVLVTKASGGAATEAKLRAARTLKVPVLMIKRPTAPTEVADPLAALDLIAVTGTQHMGVIGGV